MRILWLTYDFPYPLITGGKLRAYHLIKRLSRDHEITLFSFIRESSQLRYLSALKKYCVAVRTFRRRYLWDLRNILLAGFSPYPFAAAIYYSRRLRSHLRESLREEKYDLVHLESFYPALYLPLLKSLGLKTLLGNENVEYRIYERYARRQPLPLRPPLYFDVLKMRRFERRLWREATGNVAVSEEDAREIAEETGQACPVVANGVAVEEFGNLPRRRVGRPTVLMIGNLNYISHADAVKHFLRRIHPKVKEALPSFALVIVSGVKPKWLESFLGDPTVRFVQDETSPAKELLGLGDVVAVPVRVAGGTRLRILEAMAAGLPVVSTGVGLEGIEATSGRHVLVAEAPSRFAHEVVMLLKSRILRRKIGEQARILVRSSYTWEKSVAVLNEVYAALGRVGSLRGRTF